MGLDSVLGSIDGILNAGGNTALTIPVSDSYGYNMTTSGDYFSCPSSAANRFTSQNMTIVVEAALTDWTPTVTNVLCCKDGVSAGTRSYALNIQPTGIPRFNFSTDGSTLISVNATVATGFADSSRHHVAVERNPTTGDVRFYTSEDGVTFTQLGATVSAATGNIYDATTQIFQFGNIASLAYELSGKIYDSELYTGFFCSVPGGAVMVQDFDPEESLGASSWVASATGETWTAVGNARVFYGGTSSATVDLNKVLFGADIQVKAVDDAKTIAYSRVGGGTEKIAVAGSGFGVSSTFQNSGSSVYFSSSFRKIPKNTGFKKLIPVFTNLTITYISESGYETLFLRPSGTIEHKGVLYPITFNGQLVGNNRSKATMLADPIVIADCQPGDEYQINCCFIGNFPSNAGAVRYINFAAVPALGEGATLAANDANRQAYLYDYGRGFLAYGIVSGGNITGMNKIADGINYSSSYTAAYAYEVGSDGVTYSKQIGTFSSFVGGTPSGLTISSGTPPAGLDAWVNPRITAQNIHTNSFSGLTATCVLGVATNASAASLAIVGDSLTSPHGQCNGNGEKTLLGRALNGRCGSVHFGVNAGGAMYQKSTTTFSGCYAFLLLLASLGAISHAIIDLGTNDIALYSRTAAQVKADNEVIAATLRSYGVKVTVMTLLPRTTSTDSFATEANQTPATGFESGGHADTYNDYVRTGAISVDWNYVDARLLYQGADPTKYRVDIPCTTDGIHPTDSATTIGLGLAQSDSTMRSYFDALA